MISNHLRRDIIFKQNTFVLWTVYFCVINQFYLKHCFHFNPRLKWHVQGRQAQKFMSNKTTKPLEKFEMFLGNLKHFMS